MIKISVNQYSNVAIQKKKQINYNTNQKKTKMSWYQQQFQNAQWQKLIDGSQPNIIEILNSQQFLVQLTKKGNPDIFAWIEKQYRYFFEELLVRCLVLPLERDSHERKYKQPTQSIHLLSSVLDTIGINILQNASVLSLPTSSISYSLNGFQNMSINSGYDKNILMEIIGFIVERMFALFLQNDRKKLENTLIPGYFYRIFQCLNRFHSTAFTHVLKTGLQGKMEQLLDHYGNYLQIINCIQLILMVEINQSAPNTNLQMSTTFSVPIKNSIVQQNINQVNHPYQIKCKLLSKIIEKISNYKKSNDYILIENLIGVLIEIIRSFNNIFQGSILAEYICQPQNCKNCLQLALSRSSSLRDDYLQSQLKSLQLMKYCIHLMTPIDRMNLYPKFREMIHGLMETRKINLKTFYMLELLNQWFLAQTNQSPNTVKSISMNSFGVSGSSFSSGMSSNSGNRVCPGLNQLQQILSKNKIFQHLIRLCIESSSSNIFHKRVEMFITSVFKSQNRPIITSIFNQNDIISQTLSKTRDFKLNPYFGHFIQIIKIFTTRRIDSPVVNQVIERNQALWNQFYTQLLEPHFNQKINVELGKLDYVQDGLPLEYTVIKNKQNIAPSPTLSIQMQMEALPKITNPQLQQQNFEQFPIILMPTKTQFDGTPPAQDTAQPTLKPKEIFEESEQPISLAFKKKQWSSQSADEKQQSFESFLKRKMSQSNKAVDERRKSRTPVKMINSDLKKRKKWSEEDENIAKTDIKKINSSNERIITQSINQDVEEAVPKITLMRIDKNNMPKQVRQRKINTVNDAKLLKWIEKSKKNVKSLR